MPAQPPPESQPKKLPPLSLVAAENFPPSSVTAQRQAAAVPVLVLFPVRDAGEAANLQELLAILAPFQPALFDGVWLALGSQEPGSLLALPDRYPWVQVISIAEHLPPDQQGQPLGKGAAMRALIHYLLSRKQVRNPRAILQFFDADIKPSCFHIGWLTGPVGMILAHPQIEAAKIVYFRPAGGRLNTLLRSLLAALPCPALQQLQKLVYLLSGEIAGTLKFWTAVPFKAGYGVEIFHLAALALGLTAPGAGITGLEQMAQVFVGAMDHRHAPWASDRGQTGLDQMATAVFAALLEALETAGHLAWPRGKSKETRLLLPLWERAPDGPVSWLTQTIAEPTFPPLRDQPQLAALLL